MSVITISRGTFSGGKMLAECLAHRLGYRSIDRDVIVERAAAHEVSQDELRAAQEKPPSFLERFQHKKYLCLVLMQAALAEEVRTGKAIYHGLAGHLLLRRGTPILRVRIIAPLEFRFRMAEDRRRWAQYLYGVDWGDPSLYDVVLNLEHISIPQACRTLVTLVRDRCFQFTAECQARMNHLAVASRVRATLALNPATAHLELEVESHGGMVSLKGRLPNVDQIERLEEIVADVPGVSGLDTEELAPATHA